LEKSPEKNTPVKQKLKGVAAVEVAARRVLTVLVETDCINRNAADTPTERAAGCKMVYLVVEIVSPAKPMQQQ